MKHNVIAGRELLPCSLSIGGDLMGGAEGMERKQSKEVSTKGR